MGAEEDEVVCTRCGDAYPPGTILHIGGTGEVCDKCWWEELADEENG